MSAIPGVFRGALRVGEWTCCGRIRSSGCKNCPTCGTSRADAVRMAESQTAALPPLREFLVYRSKRLVEATTVLGESLEVVRQSLASSDRMEWTKIEETTEGLEVKERP